MKPTPIVRAMQIVIASILIFVQLASPLAAAAKTIVDQQAAEARQAKLQAAAARPILTPEAMQHAFDQLLTALPGGMGFQAGYRCSSQLILEDYRAFMTLPSPWTQASLALRDPARSNPGLGWLRFAPATPEELNQAFMWLLTSMLNFPASIGPADSQQIEKSFEVGIVMLALHYQGLGAASSAQPPVEAGPAAAPAPSDSLGSAGPGEAPALPGGAPAALKSSVALKNSAALKNGGIYGVKKALYSLRTARPLPGSGAPAVSSTSQAPQGRSTRTFGNLRVTADTFTDLGGGAVKASGDVWLGSVGGGVDFYQLSGAGDSVTVKGAALTGQGTLVLRLGSAVLFQGGFSADGTPAQPLLIPSSPNYLLKTLGDFPIVGAPTITQVNLGNGIASGQAQVHVTPPGIDKTLPVSFTLQPGAVVDGAVGDFDLAVAGTSLAVKGARLTNTAIQAAAAGLSMPARYGGGSIQVSGFLLAPARLELGGSAGAKFALPAILFGDGQKVKLIGLIGSLAAATGGYAFAIGSGLEINLPGNALNLPLSYTLDPQGNLEGTIEEISLNIIDFKLRLLKARLVNWGVYAEHGELAAPDWLGKLSVAAEQVTISLEGLRFKDGAVFTLPPLHLGDNFTISGQARLVETSTGYELQGAKASLVVTVIKDQPVTVDFIFTYKGGNFSALVDLDLPLFGGKLAIKGAGFNNEGLFVNQADLVLPDILRQYVLVEKITLSDIKISLKDFSISGGAQFKFPDFKWGDGSVFKITAISAAFKYAHGLGTFELNGTFIVNDTSFKIDVPLRLLVDSNGYWSGSIANLLLTAPGFTLLLLNAVVDSTGISTDLARITFPNLNNFSAGVQDITYNYSEGLSIGCLTFRLPNYKFSDQVSLTNIKLTMVANKGLYTFTVNGILKLNLTSNEQDISVSFMIDTQGNFSGKLSGFKIELEGFSLVVKDVEVNKEGFFVDSGELFLPKLWGGALAVRVTGISLTKRGLVIQGEIEFPDINIASGGRLALTKIRGTLTTTNATYIFSVSSILVVNPFGSATSVALKFTIDLLGNYSAKVGEFSFVCFGWTFKFNDSELNNEMLRVGTSQIILPAWANNLTVSLPGVTFDKDGFKVNGKLEIEIKEIPWGDGKVVKFTGIKAGITLKDGVYMLDSHCTLELNLPGNAQKIPLSFWWYINGDVGGAIDALELQLSGFRLSLKALSLSINSLGPRLRAGQALLVLPLWAGENISLNVRDLAINEKGLLLNGGVTLDLPNFSLVDNEKYTVKFTNNYATLTQRMAGGEKMYVWLISSTVALKFPGFSFGTTAQLKVDNGHLSGIISGWSMQLAGFTWTVSNVVVDEKQMSIETSTLKTPDWLDNTVITIKNVTITWDEGIKLADIGLPDLNLGGVVIFSKMKISLNLVFIQRWAFVFGMQGTLELHIGKYVNMSVTIRGSIGTDGVLTGSIDNLTLKIAEDWQLILKSLGFSQNGLYVDQGTLIAGGTVWTVYHISINGTWPFVHYSGGPGVPGVPSDDFLPTQEADFILHPQPTQLALQENGSRAVQVSVEGVNGADRVVNLALAGPPAGLVYSFDQTLLWPGESTTLTISDTSLLASGNYALQITGIDVSHTHTATVSLDVIKQSFALAAEPVTQTVRPGQVVTYTLDLTSANWSQPVTLALDPDSVLPNDAEVGFKASPEAAPVVSLTVTAPAVIYLAITTAMTTTSGGYWLGVIASSQGREDGAEVGLEVWQPYWQAFMPLVSR